MAIQFAKETMRDGKHYSATMTFALVPHDNKDEVFTVADKKYRTMSFAEEMRRATKPYVYFYNDWFPEGVTVHFEDILRDSHNIDPEHSMLKITTSIRPLKR